MRKITLTLGFLTGALMGLLLLWALPARDLSGHSGAQGTMMQQSVPDAGT